MGRSECSHSLQLPPQLLFLSGFVILYSPFHFESYQGEQETHQAKVRSHKKLFTTLQNPGKQFLMALVKKVNLLMMLFLKQAQPERPDVKSHIYYPNAGEV